MNLNRWGKLSFLEQMANIGSEVQRTILWKRKRKSEYAKLAFFRGLELLDLTIIDEKNKERLKELTRVREMLVDHFYFENEYGTRDEEWEKYFYSFNFAARKDY